MHVSLQGMKVAVLVANGFDEKAYIDAQKAMQAAGAVVTMVSADQSVVNGWRDTEWGLSFVSDALLSASLAADFDALYVPGGRRAVDKMQMTAHTKRFVTGFLNAMKPVVLMNDANDVIAFCDLSDSYKIADAGVLQSQSLFSAYVDQDGISAVISDDMMGFLASCTDMAKAA